MQVYDPNLIVSDEKSKAAAVAYLLQCGYPEPSVAIMSNVELVNKYHAEGWTRQPNPTEMQRIMSDVILKTVQAIPAGRVDDSIVRAIVADELQRIAPRRIEIVTPTHVMTFNGIMHYRTELVIQIAALNHAIMLVGPAGCGKTTIGEHAASALQLPFYITSTITDTHELIGFKDGFGIYHTTPFRQAYETGGVWIADEIDAWEANPLLAANSALANGYCNFPDQPAPVLRHPNFRMIATANTFGTGADRIYVGRNELDAASLDRFATINVDYDIDLERIFAGDRHKWLEHVWAIRKQVQDKHIRHVVSSRAIAIGAVALSAGVDWDLVNEIYLFKGMSQKDRDKVL